MRAARPGVVFELEITEARRGLLTFRATGARAEESFRDEPGGHRWQRVPPNERFGRVHTSTITVAVLPEPVTTELKIDEREIEWAVRRASGPGGQGVNRTESAVTLVHTPTGIMVRCQTERSQHQNKASALAVLRARLWERQRSAAAASRGADRKAQIGSGMRGDKRRTIRMQDGHVTDHVLGKRWPLTKYLNGDWD